MLNHTSDQHPWFQRARRARPDSTSRNFYVWSDTTERYREARIIFKDFETSNWTWDPVAGAYYWHRFYSHQPDLNYDNPHVQAAILRVVDVWCEIGVDGFRLDAVPYLYEREGTNCENLPETYEFLKRLRSHVEARFRDRIFLAEANQWPEDAAAYFGQGDLCQMAYHFPLMPRLFMSLRMEDRFPILDILEQTPPIPDSCQWALFLRNHDELTLEMVTDEERDYMYRVYASDPQMRINLGIRRRLAPLLGRNPRRMEFMKGLLFSLPGTPILYYGDEIGMGDNIYLGDRNAVRTPMQWSADRNAGFSHANPQRLYLPINLDPEYHYEAVNVEAEENNPPSFLWWMKRVIALRKRFKAFGRGDIRFLHPDNRKILAFVRSYQGEVILVVANLSRFVQYVDLDLKDFQGTVPVEMFGATEFPAVDERGYRLTLGPHAFYWLALQSRRDVAGRADLRSCSAEPPPVIQVSRRWEELCLGDDRGDLAAVLLRYLLHSNWFAGRTRGLKSIRILEVIPFHEDARNAFLLLVGVEYAADESEVYCVPVTLLSGEPAVRILEKNPGLVLARLETREGSEQGILCDATADRAFCVNLLDAVQGQRVRRGGPKGEIVPSVTRAFRPLRGPRSENLEPALHGTDQRNTWVLYGNRLLLKFLRRMEPGLSPDLEIGRFLTDHAFPHVPPVAGAVEYARRGQEPITLAILRGFVPNQGDVWAYTQDWLSRYLEHCLAHRGDREASSLLPRRPVLDLLAEDPPARVHDPLHPYLDMVALLGHRTAELHAALATDLDNFAFAPEAFTRLYQRSLYQAIRSHSASAFQLLRSRLPGLPEQVRLLAEHALSRETEMQRRFQAFREEAITGVRIRCHGNYHLGQVLWTGKDFVILNFEGYRDRPLSERRIKRSPLRDVASMLRSFHHAAHASWQSAEQGALGRPEDLPALDFWAQVWNLWVSVFFLRGYLEAGFTGSLLPQDPRALRVLLEFYLLYEAICELVRGLSDQPQSLRLPLEAITQILRTEP